MKPAILHREARVELDEAVAYYERRRTGLGVEFLAAVEAAIARFQQNPKLHTRYQRTAFRKCVVPRFPYVIFYRDLEDAIWITAVAHTKRRPGYWKDRDPAE